MLTDLVVNPFGAHLSEMLAIARAADDADVGAIWVSDHFSGNVVDAPWSRDPFVCLGAMAAVTERVDLGLLVANMENRHPVQLASAVNSLQSLAPHRVRFGVGSGAAPGSRFAIEHDMIGRELADIEQRRQRLRWTIDELRAAWDGSYDAVTDGASMPHLIVGASAWPTIEVAVELADGVNIRRTSRLGEQLARLATIDRRNDFEISVLDVFQPADDLGVPPDDLVAADVDRRIVTVWPSRDLAAVEQMPRRSH